MVMIQDITAQLNIDTDLELVTVKTPEEAIKFRHIGSPTIQINSLDIDPDCRNLKQYGIT